MQLSISFIRFQTGAWIRDFIKRTFDIFVSFLAIIFFSPIYGLISLAILRDSPGPVLYRGPRMGRAWKKFEILKFRTMYEVPESYQGPEVTAQDDPRVTRLGRWLRNTKLNELPQFWNVLKGEMSLVGPRPEDPSIAQHWPHEIGTEILSVRPGITSPASVQYHNEEALLSSDNVIAQYIKELGPDKIRLDQIYVRNRSFLLDLDILVWTLLILLPKIGAQPVPEQLLFVGPISRLVKRYINWFLIDLLITLAAIGTAGVAWRIYSPLDVGLLKSLGIGIAFALLFSGVGAVMGVNRVTWTEAAFTDSFELLFAWTFASLIAFTANEITKLYPTKMVIAACSLALVGFIVTRYHNRLISTLTTKLGEALPVTRARSEHVLIIGVGAAAQHVAWFLKHPMNNRKFWIAGFVEDDLFKQGTRIYGENVIGMVNDIPSLVKKFDVGVIILAKSRGVPHECRVIIDKCNATSARLVVMPDLFTTFDDLLSSRAAPMIPVTGELERDNYELPCLECMTKYGVKNSTTQSKSKV